jgi:hypothetical protein
MCVSDYSFLVSRDVKLRKQVGKQSIRSVQSNVIIVSLLAVGRWLKWIVPQPPGDVSVFVRAKYLPFVSETLTDSVFQINYGIAVSIYIFSHEMVIIVWIS